MKYISTLYKTQEKDANMQEMLQMQKKHLS